MMTEIYRTTITGAGPLAESFLAERMFVTFGEQAPDALREFCFLLAPATCSAPLAPGGRLLIDGIGHLITAVGPVAQRNLDLLGHLTVTLDAAVEPAMDGGIHVEPGAESLQLRIGTVLTVEA